MTVVFDFLEHHGIKGQKWGVRTKSRVGKRPSEFKPKAKHLSDDELKKAISRMELEKRYNDLSGASKTPNKAVTKLLGDVGQTVVKTALTALATQQVNAVLKKATSK
jgi:hypothetical protein